MDADDVTRTDELGGATKRVPVGLAAADGNRPGPPEELPDERLLEQLLLGDEEDRAAAEEPEQRMVDRGQVVRRQHRPAGRGQSIDAVCVGRRERVDDGCDQRHEDAPPQELRVVVPEAGTPSRVSGPEATTELAAPFTRRMARGHRVHERAPDLTAESSCRATRGERAARRSRSAQGRELEARGPAAATPGETPSKRSKFERNIRRARAPCTS